MPSPCASPRYAAEKRLTMRRIRKLRFDPAYQLAFEQVFAKTIVCPTLEVAGAYVRSHQLTAITLDGDKVDKKGALTGGYHDVRRSRLDCVKAARTWRGKHDEDHAKLDEARRTLRQLDQQITQLLGSEARLKSAIARAQDDRTPLVERAMALQKEEDAVRTRVAKLDALVAGQESDVRTMNAQVEAYEAELATPMTATLTDQEADRLTALTSEVSRLKKDLVDVSRSRAEVRPCPRLAQTTTDEGPDCQSTKPARGRTQGQPPTSTRRPQCQDREPGAGDRQRGPRREEEGDQGVGPVHRRRDQACPWSVVSHVWRLASDAQTAYESEAEALDSSIAEIENKLEKTQAVQAEQGRTVHRQQKSIERYIAKRQLLVQRRDECNASIRALGVLPEEAFEKYTDQKSEKARPCSCRRRSALTLGAAPQAAPQGQ